MRVESLIRPRPRCEWKVDADGEKPWHPWRRAATPQCVRRATWSLDGTTYCAQHAGAFALNKLIEESE